MENLFNLFPKEPKHLSSEGKHEITQEDVIFYPERAAELIERPVDFYDRLLE